MRNIHPTVIVSGTPFVLDAVLCPLPHIPDTQTHRICAGYNKALQAALDVCKQIAVKVDLDDKKQMTEIVKVSSLVCIQRISYRMPFL